MYISSLRLRVIHLHCSLKLQHSSTVWHLRLTWGVQLCNMADTMKVNQLPLWTLRAHFKTNSRENTTILIFKWLCTDKKIMFHFHRLMPPKPADWTFKIGRVLSHSWVPSLHTHSTKWLVDKSPAEHYEEWCSCQPYSRNNHTTIRGKLVLI